MKLVEQGKLTFDDNIRKYITELPLNWQNITIKHLLSHRGKLSKDFFSNANLQLANLSINQDVVAFLSKTSIKVKAVDFDQARHCNSCYVLLAKAIANVGGNTFIDFIQQNIFIPAGMNDSYVIDKNEAIKPNYALN